MSCLSFMSRSWRMLSRICSSSWSTTSHRMSPYRQCWASWIWYARCRRRRCRSRYLGRVRLTSSWFGNIWRHRVTSCFCIRSIKALRRQTNPGEIEKERWKDWRALAVQTSCSSTTGTLKIIVVGTELAIGGVMETKLILHHIGRGSSSAERAAKAIVKGLEAGSLEDCCTRISYKTISDKSKCSKRPSKTRSSSNSNNK